MAFHMGGDTALRNQYFSGSEVCPDVPGAISTIAKARIVRTGAGLIVDVVVGLYKIRRNCKIT